MPIVKTLAIALAIVGLAPVQNIVGHESTVVEYLKPFLKSVGGSARIYYAGECRAAEFDTSGNLQLRFPAVSLRSPSGGVTGMDAVRQIFRDDPDVAVAQDRSGMVRITVGSPSSAILQTRVQALTLNPDEQFSAPAAVVAIEGARELRVAERRLDVHPIPQTFDIIVSRPIAGAPHLPQSMKHVSIDEALDAVVRTFGGIATYGVCKQPNGDSLFELGYRYVLT